MILSFILSRLARRSGFSWSPALDLSNDRLYMTLLPGAQY